MSKFLTPRLASLAPYVPGEQPKERKYVKLNTNESPFPPSPLAVKMAAEEGEKLMLYSDPDVKDLTAALAARYGVKPENVVVTNGSDEALNFAFMAFCGEDMPALFPDITYGFYKVFAQINGVPYEEIPLKEDFTIDLAEYHKRQGVVFIANPNAPTGIFLPLTEIEALVRQNPSRIVVVDEAYIDFGGESALSLIKKYDNLLVTQTFSKSRSMAGARLGFAVGSSELIADLHRVRYSTNPYNVNRMTAAAGVGAIKDEAYFQANCQKIVQTRAWAAKELSALGFTMTHSTANFLFVKHEAIAGKKLYEELKKRGVLVRHFDKPRIAGYNRITVGSEEEMQTLLAQIKTILEIEYENGSN
ncbi:MAG: histidinol-phosphate transaminase [Clostridia bacterium]|nr:histidinol-phosphate transaminase [Clostridia bacterium]